MKENHEQNPLEKESNELEYRKWYDKILDPLDGIIGYFLMKDMAKNDYI